MEVRVSVSVPAASKLLGISRNTLRVMLDELPADLPDAPALVGVGRIRAAYRWVDEPALRRWWAAVTAYRASQRAERLAARRAAGVK